MYDPSSLWPLTGSIEGEANGWLYVNNQDLITTITSSGFLATGGEAGMKVGDLVWVINQVTPSSTACQVTAVATGGALHLPTSATIAALAGPATGGPILPSSIYLGGASGNLYPNFYVPATNTNNAGALEGVGVLGSLGSDAAAVLQFNMPESIPSGTLRLRCLAMANATSGVAKLTVKDKNVAAGSSLGTSTLNGETQLSQTWATADILVENKITLTSTPSANDILTVLVTFNTSGWNLAAASTWQFSIVWE